MLVLTFIQICPFTFVLVFTRLILKDVSNVKVMSTVHTTLFSY